MKYLNRFLFYSLILIVIGAKPEDVERLLLQSSTEFHVSDTAVFNPNREAGWDSYNSYGNQIGDSVDLEIILYRTSNDSINWEEPTIIGTINPGIRPQDIQRIRFVRAFTTWQLFIQPSGECELSWISGTRPGPTGIVIPIQVKYKK